MRVSQIYELSEKEYNTKKQYLISLGNFVTKSTQTETIAKIEILPEIKYKKGVIEVFHLNLGPTAIHCLMKKSVGIRKKKYVYQFCYHHETCCPHIKLMLKRKTL
jgi:hypothetical protein